MPVCVVFDLDDTLYLERDYVRSGFSAAGAWCEDHLQLHGIGELAWSLFNEGRRGDIFDAAVRERLGASAEPQAIQSLVQVYRNHTPEIRLTADAAQCLARIGCCVQMAIITDGHPVSQWKKIDALEIRERFEAIIVTGEWGAEFSKPNPRAFRKIESDFPASEKYFYVADNPRKDFTAPRALGWRNVRVRRESGLYSEIRCPEQLLDYEIPDLSRLSEIVL
jgi:putative hydrolase of the HAD superfamily